MTSLWQKNKDRRRRQILTAARRLILAGGLDALTMRDLAAAAEVSVRTLYNLLGTQEHIVAALIDEAMTAMEAAVAATPAEAPLDRLAAIMTASAAVLIRDAGVHRPAYIALWRSPAIDAAARFRGRSVLVLTDGVARAQRAGLIDDAVAASTLGEQVFFTANRVLLDWAEGRQDDAAFQAHLMLALWLPLLGLAAPAAAARMRLDIAAAETALRRRNAA